MKVLGIDSGNLGALCFYDGETMNIYDMPVFEKGEKKLVNAHEIHDIIQRGKPDFCMLERTHARPITAKAVCFSMGYSYGVLIGIIASLKIPYAEQTPQNWKREMNCPADKEMARQRATILLPQFAHNWPLKKHDGRAESALLALYGLTNKKVNIYA